MALILNIETATKNCSVSLSENGLCLSLLETSAEKFVHAERLHGFVKQVLQQSNKMFNQLDAVAVSNGPGSYTGLRIGISAAKGFCYATDTKLIALNTNDILAASLAQLPPNAHVLSVIDARRNEVYARQYNAQQKAVSEIAAVILDEESYDELGNTEVHVVGDAADKTAEIIALENVIVHHQFPSAKDMCGLAEEKFNHQDFVDVAYHEPFYLKDFVAGKPKKLL